jgi:hypothetical protein
VERPGCPMERATEIGCELSPIVETVATFQLILDGLGGKLVEDVGKEEWTPNFNRHLAFVFAAVAHTNAFSVENQFAEK